MTTDIPEGSSETFSLGIDLGSWQKRREERDS